MGSHVHLGVSHLIRSKELRTRNLYNSAVNALLKELATTTGTQ
jgi:hypothetical protein